MTAENKAELHAGLCDNAGPYRKCRQCLDVYNTRAASPPASGEVVERVAERIADRILIDANDRDYEIVRNELVEFAGSLQAAGAAAVPEGWVLVKRSDRVERSWEGDESGRYNHSCAACQRQYSGPKWQNLCRICTEFPPVRHPADVERSRAEALEIASRLAAAPER